MKFLKRTFVASSILLSTFSFAEGRLRSDLYEDGAPEFNGIEIPTLKFNKLSEVIGDNRVDADVYLGQYLIFDDNIYKSGSNKVSDEIHATVVGASIMFSEEDLYDVTLSTQFRNLDYHVADSDEFFYDLDLTGNFKINEMLKTGFSVGLNQADESEGPGEEASSLTQYASAYLDITPTEQFGLYLSVKGTDLDNKVTADKSDDYISHELSAMPYLKFETGKIGLRYTYGQKNFDRDLQSDALWNEYAIVFEKQLSEKISLDGEFGYHMRTYKSKSSASRADGDNSWQGFVGALGVNYDMTEKLSLNARYAHTIGDGSTISNYVRADRISLGAVYTPITELKLKAGTYMEKSMESNGEDYDMYGASLSATYSLNEYFALGASYSLEKKDSAFVNDDYINNVITIGVSASF